MPMTDGQTNGLDSQVYNYVTTVMGRDYIGYTHKYIYPLHMITIHCGNYVYKSHSVEYEQ